MFVGWRTVVTRLPAQPYAVAICSTLCIEILQGFQIDTDHSPVAPDILRGSSRDKARPAGNVENALGWLERGHVDEATYPGFHEEPHVPIVEFRRVAAQLPTLFIAHD